MRVLLRDVTTGRYFRGGNSWNARAEDAFDFHDPRSAVRGAIKVPDKAAEIVFTFDDHRLDIVVPVNQPLDTRHWRKVLPEDSN